MPAFYASSVFEFMKQPAELIVGHLTTRAGDAGYFQQLHTQTRSWCAQVAILQRALRDVSSAVTGGDWSVLLEYPIPRRGKRIDAVLLLSGFVAVMEFKCGARSFDRNAIEQVEDYCLDLRDFHSESKDWTIVPLLVATHGPNTEPPVDRSSDVIRETWRANEGDLAAKLRLCSFRYAGNRSTPDLRKWNEGEYSPTPTIVEAAQALYAGHSVREISRCHAGIDNLTRTSEAVTRLAADACKSSRKLICFVTGIPGAGKTLAGLNIVHSHGHGDRDLGVFLSGNGPLVRVLTEALARDHQNRTGLSRSASHRHVSTFVQNVHRFIGEYFAYSDKVPIDRVAVFDEAQRAWDAEQSRRKFKRDFSEPEMMLEIMDRHENGAVIVALVGVGQEINTGEAGLGEWGRALVARFPHWTVAVSPELLVGTSTGQGLFPSVPCGMVLREEPALHLNVNLRSYKAERLSEFVNALLDKDSEQACRLASQLGDYPIAMTRSLEVARRWLRRRQRGTRRIGLVASSGARRLLAHGLDVTCDLDVENWFLNPTDDVRSSFYLEVPATEFGIQGLELDWIGLCWGGDLVPSGDGWLHRKFRGTQWQLVRNAQTQRYVINKYRVLLTRAREGMVMWVPPGNADDPTRPPELYDQIAGFLRSCGLPELNESPS